MDDTEASSLWAFILADILGVILRFLPCLADRAAVRSVCWHWRSASRGHCLPPPPLPLLVLPRFRFFSFSTHGAVVSLRHGGMPEGVATVHVVCVGSCEGWLLVARPRKDAADREHFFLVNTFSHKVIGLPCMSASYCNTSGERVVLSAPPGSATKCIVAGFSYHRGVPGLSDWSGFGITLWQPGMKTWYIYLSRSINSSLNDLVFHEGKLYTLQSSWYAFQSPLLFAFTLGEDEKGVNIFGHECPVTMPPIFPRPGPALWARCNLVQWRGRLVVIIRYIDVSPTDKVDVFALDLSINPCGVTKINSFDGDCVFVDKCRCTCFPASSYDGVQGDCIYNINRYKNNNDEPNYVITVYNMRDCTVKPLTAELLSSNPAEDKLASPVWMFPPE